MSSSDKWYLLLLALELPILVVWLEWAEWVNLGFLDENAINYQ